MNRGDGVFEENILEIYFVAGVVSFLKLNIWMWDTTEHLQIDIITGIIVLDILYIFQHLIFYLNINTVYFAILVFNYNFHFVNSISHFEQIYRYDCVY